VGCTRTRSSQVELSTRHTITALAQASAPFKLSQGYKLYSSSLLAIRGIKMYDAAATECVVLAIRRACLRVDNDSMMVVCVTEPPTIDMVARS
jgi:hypothetical protein